MPDSGHGVSITFSSGFMAAITNVSHSGISRAALETTSSATTTYKTFIPADLIDYGSTQVDLEFNPNDTPPISGAAETITITFPVPSGSTNGATLAFSGFMTEFQFTVPAAQDEGIMTATATLKATGAPTWVDAS